MSKKLLPLVGASILLSASGALAQSDKLAFLIPLIYGPGGLFVNSQAPLPDGSTHSAHFNSSFQSEFTQFNIALASQIATLPVPSPASGFTYEFDPAVGTFSRTTQSFGPILAERAETIGKNRFTFGLNYQFFNFDSIEGLDVNEIPAVFTHDNPTPGGRADVVTTINAIDTSVSQLTFFFTYGVGDRFDVSVGVPVVSTDVKVSSDATIQRLGTASDLRVHFYDDGQGGFGNNRVFRASGSATGIGDVLIRLKATAAKSGPTGLGLGVDFRLPTGDELDLLGTGTAGIKPFAALSFANPKFSPHLNVAYQWNGDSVLAGNVLTDTKEDFPDQFLWIFGADIGVTERLTVAFDILGQTVIDSPRLVTQTFTGLDPAGTTFQNIVFEPETFSIVNGAVGLKVNPGGDFLIDFNLLFKLNDAGLRENVAPLIGIEYSF